MVDLNELKVKSDYEFKLSNFEGPLDLLLHLIKEAKIDIRDIFLSQVTEQYLAYMSQVDAGGMEKASDFLDVAATLLEIKSGSLLPKLEEEETDEEDPQERFIRMMEEYALLKEAGLKMKETENVNRFYRDPDDNTGKDRIVFTDFNLEGLLDAFSKLLIRLDQRRRDVEEPKEIRKERFTLPQKIHFIKTSLMENKHIMFSELFDEESNRGEVITTFLAILEICKEQYAGAVQNEIFGDIEIFLKEGNGIFDGETE